MSKICPCCKTRNKDNVEFCVKCKNPLDLTDYIESKKLDLKFGSKLKSSFGMESKEDKVNLEIEKFIKLYQKFIGFDKDLNDLKSFNEVGNFYYKNHDKIYEILQYRNESILAHGFKVQSEEDFNVFEELVLILAEKLDKNFELYLEETKFPEFP